MDYDRTAMPAVYDLSRDHGPAFLVLWMDTLAAHLRGRRVDQILDLGCGTGRFTGALGSRFEAEVVGVDPSTKMLERAMAKPNGPRVSYRAGAAEAIPLPAGAIDVVFMSMSFHHFTDRGLAAAECRRVLKAGGTLFVRNGTREQGPNYPYVPFFPAAMPILERMLPDLATLTRVFEGAGFRLSTSEVVRQTIAPTWEAYVEKVAARGDSVIASLTDDEMAAGLAAMRAHRPDGRPVTEPIDLLVFRRG